MGGDKTMQSLQVILGGFALRNIPEKGRLVVVSKISTLKILVEMI